MRNFLFLILFGVFAGGGASLAVAQDVDPTVEAVSEKAEAPEKAPEKAAEKALEEAQEKAPEEAPAKASENDVWDDLGDFFGGIFGGDSEEQEKKKEPETTDNVIKAKRLEDDSDKSTKQEAPREETQAPYKVYQAPVIEGQAFPDWHDAPDSGGSIAVQGQQETPSSNMPAAASVPTQFLPVFPLGVSEASTQLLPIASNIPLAQNHDHVQRVIIVIHDIARDAAASLAIMATLSGASQGETLLIAPQFPLEADVKRFAAHLPQHGQKVIRWPVVEGWPMGGQSMSVNQRGISSFTALDVLLLFLADTSSFPHLRDVVIAGHGMGADFVQRYAAVGMGVSVLESQRVGVRFLVANPSSYLYLTASRPLGEGLSFGLPKGDSCQGGNSYPYGLDHLLPYAKRIGATRMRQNYPARRVTYLIGDKIEDDPYLDRSCAGLLQGSSRLSRARAYARYMMQSFGNVAAWHQFHAVKDGGYDPVAIFGSSCGLSFLFGDGGCQ